MRSLLFDDFYRLADAALLAGAHLIPAPLGRRLFCLAIKRSHQHRNVLAVLGCVLERHGLHLRVQSGPATIGSKIVLQSSPNRFLAPVADRWYPELATTGRRQIVTPRGLLIDEPTLALWAMDAIAKSANRPTVRFTTPRLGFAAAKELQRQLRSMGWRVKQVAVCEGNGYLALDLAARQRPELEAWLADRIPRGAWSREPELRRGTPCSGTSSNHGTPSTSTTPPSSAGVTPAAPPSCSSSSPSEGTSPSIGAGSSTPNTRYIATSPAIANGHR